MMLRGGRLDSREVTSEGGVPGYGAVRGVGIRLRPLALPVPGLEASSVFNHAPDGYDCPFCRLGRGLDTSASSREDIVYRNADVLAFVPSSRWPNNPGHVLVIPTAHYENVYDLPPELATPIQRVVRAVALAFKEAYRCQGVSIRQHNEPAGQQDAWHYHQHVFPRYDGDDLYLLPRLDSTPEERRPFATRLRKILTRGNRAG
jgi:histidine triad (HIT) family protein